LQIPGEQWKRSRSGEEKFSLEGGIFELWMELEGKDNFLERTIFSCRSH
jgi:hypothetical protein